MAHKSLLCCDDEFKMCYSTFLPSLYKMMQAEHDAQGLIEWDESGTIVILHNVNARNLAAWEHLMLTVGGFKHANRHSLMRQLNYYGFERLRHSMYRNQNFYKDATQEDLAKIVRKTNKTAVNKTKGTSSLKRELKAIINIGFSTEKVCKVRLTNDNNLSKTLSLTPSPTLASAPAVMPFLAKEDAQPLTAEDLQEICEILQDVEDSVFQ